MHTRREILRSSAVGTAIGIGVLTSSSTATAAGASFGDGVNLQPSYYCSGDQDLGWELMAQYPDIQTLRIEIEPPSRGESQAEMEDAKRWIDEAVGQGYDVIATYHHHPHNGSSNTQDLQAAADWWVEHYDYLSQDASFTVNLMNEWGDHSVGASQYAAAYNDAISTVRNGTGYTGSIVIDVPGWGGNTNVAADAASSITNDDIVISAHIYPSGWNDTEGEYLAPDHLDVLEQTGVPCMIGEFGDTGDGEGDWAAVIGHASSLGWPVIGWAWNGDGENLNMASPAWTDGCDAPYSRSSYFETIYEKLGGGNGGGAGSGGDGGNGGGNGGGGNTGGDGTDGDTGEDDERSDATEWDPATVYTSGDRVTWNGRIWEAQWWTQNQEPRDEAWYVWQPV